MSNIDMSRVLHDGELIRQHVCPVCRAEIQTTGNHKALKAHITRKKDGEHFAWRIKYWGIHYCKNGWATRTRDHQFRHLIKALRREFGQDMLDAIKVAG